MDTPIAARRTERTPHSSRGRPRSVRRAGLLMVGLGALLGAVGCGDAERPGAAHEASPGRNVLILTLDTTRADHLGVYGYPLDLTPEIDELARRGVVFENSYAPMPQTLPSHTTLMTGLQPRQHGTLENTYTVDERLDTLAEMLAREGYATAAFVSALVLSEGSGIHQGFEQFGQPRTRFNVGLPAPAEREATEMTDVALEWAEQHPSEKPFLLWVHYFDPHADHVAPRRYQRQVMPMEVRDQVIKPKVGDALVSMPRLVRDWRGYAAEVRYTDAEIGRLLDGLQELGLLEDTVVVLAGDHGEGLYEHGNVAHGTAVWEELHRVPLILVHPDGRHAGKRVAGRAELADVLPTVLSMALGHEGDTHAGERGIDLWTLLESGRAVPERPVYLERPHYSLERFADRTGGGKGAIAGYLTAVIMGDHKLVRRPDGSEQLYDLVKDPDESRDLADKAPQLRAKLAGLLDGWLERNQVGPPGEQGELSEERIEALKALGYLGGDG